MPPEDPSASRSQIPRRQAAAPSCALGKIVNTHGIRGEVRMSPYNPESDTLRSDQMVTLRWPDRSLSAHLCAVRPHKRFRLLTFEGYTSATAAEDLVGAEVWVDAAALPPVRPGEFYHHDLIGLRVETVEGELLGTVEGVLTTGSNDVCVVRGDGAEHLIPLIADVVRDIDLARGRMVIDPIPGLLD